jgi:hypothetical protein
MGERAERETPAPQAWDYLPIPLIASIKPETTKLMGSYFPYPTLPQTCEIGGDTNAGFTLGS